MDPISFFFLAVRFATITVKLAKWLEKMGVSVQEIEEHTQQIINNIDDEKVRAEFRKIFKDEHDYMGS